MKVTVTRFDTSRAAVIEYTCPGCGPLSATFAAGDDTFVHDCDQADEECLPMAGAAMTDGVFRAALVVVAALVSTGVLYALAGISVPVALAASIAVAASMARLIAGDE